MKEIEVKIKIRENDDIVSKLSNIGAMKVGNLLQIDHYFSYPSKDRDFSKTDEGLRLRKTEFRPNNSEQLIFSSDLTYKGPKDASWLKMRKELVCDLKDPKNMDEILRILGFPTIAVLHKNREMWHISLEGQNIDVVIDQIQELDGKYLESEIIVDESNDRYSEEKAMELIQKFLSKLEYSKDDSIMEGYLELFIKKG